MERNALRGELEAVGREMDRLTSELWNSNGLEKWLAHVLSVHSVLITAPINMIDDERRIVVQQKRDDDTTYGPILLLLIRSYLTALQIYFEEGLRAWLESRSIEVRPTQVDGWRELMAEIAHQIPASALKKLKHLRPPERPSSQDYLEKSFSLLPKAERGAWRAWFAAFGIMRNKSSHSNPRVSESEAKRLHEGGLGALVSGNVITLNFQTALSITNDLIRYCKRLDAERPAPASGPSSPQ